MVKSSTLKEFYKESIWPKENKLNLKSNNIEDAYFEYYKETPEIIWKTKILDENFIPEKLLGDNEQIMRSIKSDDKLYFSILEDIMNKGNNSFTQTTHLRLYDNNNGSIVELEKFQDKIYELLDVKWNFLVISDNKCWNCWPGPIPNDKLLYNIKTKKITPLWQVWEIDINKDWTIATYRKYKSVIEKCNQNEDMYCNNWTIENYKLFWEKIIKNL